MEYNNEIPIVEIFTTNVQNKHQVSDTLKILSREFPELRINFDLSDFYLYEKRIDYPCKHSILRVEGHDINIKRIVSIVNESGFKCDIFEDRKCK